MSPAAGADAVEVLVVDDNPANLIALEATLVPLGCRVVAASSGVEALGKLMDHEFAVILLDVVMPYMDGFETASRIRQYEATRRVPLIFLTAESHDERFAKRGYSVGAVDYLIKPVAPDVVRAKVKVFVDLYRKTEGVRRQEVELREAVEKRGDEALRETRALYEATFQKAPVGIAHANLDGTWVRVNQHLCEILKYPQRELLGRRFQDLAHPDDVEEIGVARERLAAGDAASYRTERRFIDKTGAAIWVNLTVSALGDATRPTLLVTVMEAITERKHAEESQRFLTEASEILLSSLDYRSVVQQIVTLAVPLLGDACMVHLGDTTAGIRCVASYGNAVDVDVIAMAAAGFVDLALESRRPLVLSAADAGLERTCLLVVPLRRREGRLGSISFAYRTDSSRARTGLDVALAEDLAHRVAFAVENARLYDEAQSAIRARDEFLSIASHELRTPLTPLQLELQRLLSRTHAEGLAAVVEERLKVTVERCHRQVQRIVALIDTLLDVSRIRSGNLRLNPETVDLADVVRDVAARFGEELAGARCPIEIDAQKAVGRWDRLRLEQVFTNLLANAIKYGGGQPIHVTVEADHAFGRLTVTDRGIGIAAEELDRIFGRFERAVSSRAYGGLGLGLYITQQIVDAHGGTVRVVSALGAGSTFVVELPFARVSDHSMQGGR